MKKNNSASAANRTELGKQSLDSSTNGPGVENAPPVSLTEIVASQPHISRGIVLKLMDVRFPHGTSEDDQTRLTAAIQSLFEQRVRKCHGLYTGHSVEEDEINPSGRRALVPVQLAYQPELVIAELNGRPVQSLLREWLRKGVQVDLLFYEPDATAQTVVYAWFFENCYPQSTGSDEVDSAGGSPLEYSIYFSGEYNADLDGAIAQAYNLLIAEAKEKQPA